MPRPPRVGETINGYTIKEHLNTGMMAHAYAASAPSGDKVFFKYYKSPSCAKSWYRGYLEYQKELKRRLESHLVGKFCVRLLDQFEFGYTPTTPQFYQVFEFVHSGEDLEQILARLRRSPRSLDWNQRHILAKVMMAAIHQLHEAKIIHGDLKPPNLQLFRDRGIAAGYQLKLIDMDFSILSDRRAPWHGDAAYVGTAGYFSPEHWAGGVSVPKPASDVFTCGLILYELLAGGHPYHFDDEAQYRSAVEAHSAKKPTLLGKIDGDTKKTDAFANILYQCLSPNAANRPSAKEVHLALNGHLALSDPPTASPVPPALPRPASRLKDGLLIANSTGARQEVGVTTHFGKALLRNFGAEAKYADDFQFVLERRESEWWIVPPPSPTKNHTMINGEILDSPKRLKNGDQVAIGSRTTKGRTVLPLTITL